MKRAYLFYLLLSLFVFSCKPAVEDKPVASNVDIEDFQYLTEQFADLKILRYKVPGFDQLSLDQKKLVYYLTQAGLSGRDIIWDQNFRHNLAIRAALENIVRNYDGDKTIEEWQNFMTYTKRVWFSNGIHHHYGMDKFEPLLVSNTFKVF